MLRVLAHVPGFERREEDGRGDAPEHPAGKEPPKVGTDFGYAACDVEEAEYEADAFATKAVRQRSRECTEQHAGTETTCSAKVVGVRGENTILIVKNLQIYSRAICSGAYPY